MIHRFLKLAADPTTEPDLRHEAAAFVRSLRASAGQGDAEQVARVEAAVAADPVSSFAFDDSGLATLSAAGGSWQAGRFETPTIGELLRRARERRQGATTAPEARLWVFDGASPATDIGSLQATAEAGSLFQVASQFNCLESPGPFVTHVSDYFNDLTQGPRASISAFPATLLRHYSAPGADGKRFVQKTGRPQIDLLAEVLGSGKSPVRDGYLVDPGRMGGEAFAAALEAGFDRVRVGVHHDAQVVLGYNWDGAVVDSGTRRITQVFTSTVAGGGYGGASAFGAAFRSVCRQTLRAAYLGTLLAAVARERTIVVLTLIGGGVFGNPIDLIWEAILGAFDEVRPLVSGRLDVVLNGYNLSRLIDLGQILPGVRDRGGVVLRFGSEGLIEVRR
jgi:hypothetical protein